MLHNLIIQIKSNLRYNVANGNIKLNDEYSENNSNRNIEDN